MDTQWTMSTRIANCVTHDDLARTAQGALGSFNTPVLKLKADARQHYDSVCLPLTTAAWRDRWRELCISLSSDHDERSKEAEQRAERWRANPSFERDEVTMTRLDEGENVTGIVSDWLELDSLDDWVRHDSEIALKQEIEYAAYLNIHTLVLPPPRERAHVAFYGRAIRSCLENTHFLHLSVRLPIYDPSAFLSKSSPRSGSSFSPPPSPTVQVTPTSTPDRGSARRDVLSRAPEGELSGTWEMWDVIRSMCDYNPKLTITLDLTPPLPASQGILARWVAEPIQHVLLPTSTFIPNAKGYPVLPKGTQVFLQDLMKNHPTVILSGTGQHLHSRGSEDKYIDYIRYLEKSSPHVKLANEENTLENYSQGYQDYLQMPLQPLQDHLGSAVYENFERDPVKYSKYEEAVFNALVDRPSEKRIVICVAGAGRGPLVARSLRAVERSGRQVSIYAIEKNPNAFVTLQERQDTEWRDRVKILFGDMRLIDVPEKADILVSELLGSFGDNELSPECLDGAMRFLKDDGISIPSSYTAHLAPLSSSKLYQEAGGSKDSKDKDKQKNLETPYVVMIQAAKILSESGGGIAARCGAQIQECWEFEHPRKDIVLNAHGLPLTNYHNSRSATLSFHIPHAGILHGFAGYFEAVLYGNIGLSIHPDRKDRISKDMLSWFPCFFPIKEPLYLPSNSELQMSIWRLTGNHKVWYEWCAETFLPVSNLPQGTQRLSLNPLVNGAGSLMASASTPVAAPSPMIDAVDSPFGWEKQVTPMEVDTQLKFDMSGVIKIGQTMLHNPGGRSSWYGL